MFRTIVSRVQILVLTVMGVCALGTTAMANDPGQGWGNVATTAPANTLTTANSHYINSLTAVTVINGQNTLLPGASLNAIGVYNSINVVGDNNLVDAIQDGTNTGSVTTTVNVN